MRGTLSILTRTLTALFTREDDGFVALCPELDVASQVASVVEAKANLRETVELFFESASEAWVVGIQIGGVAKAYDWNRLVRERIIHDQLGNTRILLVLEEDQRSFAAFERPDEDGEFLLQSDILISGGKSYDFAGRNLQNPAERLRPVTAHQEFWHSWRTFHPATLQY